MKFRTQEVKIDYIRELNTGLIVKVRLHHAKSNLSVHANLTKIAYTGLSLGEIVDQGMSKLQKDVEQFKIKTHYHRRDGTWTAAVHSTTCMDGFEERAEYIKKLNR